MDFVSGYLASSPRAQRETLAAALLEKHRRRWRKQPSAFVREVLQTEPTSYQAEILDAVLKYRRVAARSPHGASKTSIAAWLVLWAVTSFEPDFVGSGMYARLCEQNHPYNGTNVNAFAHDSERFVNLRKEICWHLRKHFQNGELTAMKFKCASIGKIVLKSKHEMKERLGCSLDLADALALVFFEKQKRRGVWLLD